jgi:hypothetical protein
LWNAVRKLAKNPASSSGARRPAPVVRRPSSGARRPASYQGIALAMPKIFGNPMPLQGLPAAD